MPSIILDIKHRAVDETKTLPTATELLQGEIYRCPGSSVCPDNIFIDTGTNVNGNIPQTMNVPL